MATHKIRWMFLSIVGIMLTTWVAVGFQNRRVDDNALKNAGKNGEEWLTYGLNYQETRYSPLKQIDTKNVGRLGLAWTYEIGPGGGNQEATPLVSNGVLYSITQWSVTYAVDLRTGKELWRYDPMVNRQTTQPCCGVVHRGVALHDGKVIVPVLDGRLEALNAKDGKLLWSTMTVPENQPYTITMAPRIVKNKVIIGNAGSEFPVRGFFSAYDVNTGKMAWRFYTVPGDPSKPFEHPDLAAAAKTWGGEWYKMGGGGTVWDAISYDPDSNLVYVGTGNGGPWPSELRQSKGLDNLYVCSIIAVDADTGAYKWHYQVVPEDSWDYDSVQQLTIADLRINGQTRKVIMQANKNGFFYVLDRLTGKLISAEPFAMANWATEIDLRTGRPMINPLAFYGSTTPINITPGPGGAHNWAPMSFNPNTGLVYLPASSSPRGMSYTLNPNFVYQERNADGRAVTNMGTGGGRGGGGGGGNRGAAPAPTPGAILDPGAALGAGQALPPTPAAAPNSPVLPTVGPTETGGFLIAWNPVTQKELWRAQGGAAIGGGTVTTAGNLVFQTLSNGTLRAYSADKGEKLLDVPTGQTGGMGPPITFLLDGKQYVAVAGGSGPRGGGGGGGGGGGAGRGGAAAGPGAPAAPGAPGAPVAPGGVAAGAPAAPAPNAGAGGAQRGGGAPGAPAAPAGPPVLPRLYVYVIDGKAVNPTPPPPAPPAGAPGAPAAPGGRGQ